MGIRYIKSVQGSMGWIAMAGLSGVLACTHANPEFSDDPAQSEDAGPTNGQNDETTTPTTSSNPGPSTSADPSHGTTSTPPTSGDPSSGFGSTTETNDTTDGPRICNPEFGTNLTLTIQPPPNNEECLDDVPLAVQIQSGNGRQYEVQFCLMCPCMPQTTTHTLSFPVQPPLLPSCFILRRDLIDELGDLVCSTVNYGIYTPMGYLLQVVANVEHPTFPHPFSFELGSAPAMECGEGCDPPPGFYDLVDAEGTVVPTGGPAVTLDDEFEVLNPASGYQTNCDPIVRWHATRMGM